MLRYFYLLYATKKEMAPYLNAVAQRNGLPLAVTKRAIGSRGFNGGRECLNAVNVIGLPAFHPKRQEHYNDCIKCHLRIDLWAAMNDIVLVCS